MASQPIRRRTRTSATAAGIDTGLTTNPTNRLHNALQLQISYVDPAALKPPPRLLRKNSSRQMNAIATSIRSFGFNNPILVDRDNRIVCGHARWLAAKDVGIDAVPVIPVEHLSPEQLRLYALAENKCGELGEWDIGALKLEFSDLLDATLSTDLNIELSGFSTAEVDVIQDFKDPAEGAGGEAMPPPPTPVTHPDDLWVLGEHRLLCGSALEEASFTTLMGEERAQMVFSDPPFNLPGSMISGLGKVQHGDFAMAAGEMSQAEFTGFLTTSFGLMARYSIDGAIHFLCMDWRHIREMQDAGEAVYSELKNLIVWDKQKGGMGSCYRSQHELIFMWKNGKGRHINNFGLGENGRYRTNVWAYQGNNSFHRNRNKELQTHATKKPLLLVADAIRDCSQPGGIILDAFGGSGTTLLAAEHTRRRARLIELEPRFCDATILAWQERTGGEAVLAETGQTWTEVASARGIDLAISDDDEDFAWGEDDENSLGETNWTDGASDDEGEEG